MAVSNYGPLVTGMSGREGGNVHIITSTRGLIRRWRTAAGQSSGRAQVARQYMHQVAYAWTNNLTDAERADWSTYGDTYPGTNVFGCTTPRTGYQAFAGAAMNQLAAKVPLGTSPPAAPDARSPTGLAATARTSTQQLLITSYGATLPAGSIFQVKAGPPQPVGTLSDRSAVTIVGNFPDPSAPPLDCSPAWLAAFGPIPAGRKIALRLYVVTAATGDRGPFLSLVLQTTA